MPGRHLVFLSWWRRGESNPCPKTTYRCFLRVYSVFWDSPPRSAHRQAMRFGIPLIVTGVRASPDSRSPLVDARARAAVLPGQTAALIRQQQQQCCCYLIYKLPVLWRSGAAARLSRLHTPVETGTPPYHRGKLRSLRFREAAFGCPWKLRIASLPLLFLANPLRWVSLGP